MMDAQARRTTTASQNMQRDEHRRPKLNPEEISGRERMARFKISLPSQ
jgi:hypothetical protein